MTLEQRIKEIGEKATQISTLARIYPEVVDDTSDQECMNRRDAFERGAELMRLWLEVLIFHKEDMPSILRALQTLNEDQRKFLEHTGNWFERQGHQMHSLVDLATKLGPEFDMLLGPISLFKRREKEED